MTQRGWHCWMGIYKGEPVVHVIHNGTRATFEEFQAALLAAGTPPKAVPAKLAAGSESQRTNGETK